MSSARKVAILLLILDVICIVVAFNLVSELRGLGTAAHWMISPLSGPILLHIFAVYLIDGYSARTDMMSLDYTSQHTIALVNAMLATLLMTFVIIPAGFELQSSRIVIVLSYVLLVPLTLAYRRVLYQRLLHRRGTRSLIFVGDPASSRAFAEECRRMETLQPVIYATLGPAPAVSDTAGGGPVTRHFSALLLDIGEGRLPVEAIVLRETNRELDPALSQQLVRLYFSGVSTYTLELFHQTYWRKIPLYRLNQTWLFQEGFQIAREPVFERLKRVTDILLASVGLLLASPLIFLGSFFIWLEDRGPVFFAQNRIGKNHAPFRLYKLRSMRTGDTGGGLYTQPGDTRITRTGRFLRAARVDEFPQLWNVLRGDMSLIGPRAEWDRLVENYEREIPCYHFRHLVKPGITGWAQVNYPYGSNLEDTLRKLEYDLYYIRHFSFTLDASIVLKTIHIMLFGKGR
jgi:exopolysaccharide biosynthesis polyprenyl glycosylphosphotransferase